MVVLPVKQYYPQTDSATGHGDRMCFSSTCAMAVKYLMPNALRGSNADDDYLRTVLKYGDTTEYPAQIKACKDYGVTATFRKNGKKEDLLSELQKGFPVATGILHKGPSTFPRGGGHWMLLIGDTAESGVFYDPYGKMDNKNGGYITVGWGGNLVSYDWFNWLKRWEVEGRGTGWMMTFRPTVAPANPHIDNSWAGVKKAAAIAGAKWPEVVAAQWALESGYGQYLSGKNNYFGIKSSKDGTGTLLETKEFVNGKQITIKDWFEDFASLQDCISNLVSRWYKDYKNFKGVNQAKSPEECARLLVFEGYATDPKYADKLIELLRRHG